MDAMTLPRPVGFVFGGGGSLGAIQVGMLQALTERGITADLVVGTSVGSMNGAAVARDPKSAVNRLSHAWARTSEQVFPGGLFEQVRTLRRNKSHLFPNTGLAGMISDFVAPATCFADLVLPFAAIATDVATAAPHMIDAGPLLPALLASAAIPGIYPPVEHDGRRLYDGGLVANVPLRQALSMGARSLVVLDCAFPGRLPAAPDTFADALLFTAIITMRSQAVLEAPLAAAEVPVVYLPGPALRRVSPLDFDHTELLIADAYEAARRFLGCLRVDGPGLYGSPFCDASTPAVN